MKTKPGIVRLRDRNQLTLPTAFCEALNLSTGDGLVAELRQGGLFLRPLRIFPLDSASGNEAAEYSGESSKKGLEYSLDLQASVHEQLLSLAKGMPIHDQRVRALSEADLDAIVSRLQEAFSGESATQNDSMVRAGESQPRHETVSASLARPR